MHLSVTGAITGTLRTCLCAHFSDIKTKSTSRQPTPERYARNAAFYPGPACMLPTNLLVPSSDYARVRRCGVADNKSRFLPTRRLCVPPAQWRLVPAAKFDLQWSAKANLIRDENARLSHRNNRT